jgi:hypothetical protein
MKKKLLTGLATGALILSLSTISTAAIIDFEGFATNTEITNQYQGLGVTFANIGSAGTWGGISNGDPGNWDLEGTNGASFYGIQADAIISLSFDSIIDDFSLDTSRSLGSQNTNTFTLTAYLGGSSIAQQTITQAAINDWTTVSFTGFSFDEVQLTSANGSRPVYGIDNVTFNESAPVPEPSTILLFGAGLAGLVGFNRRRKN